MGKLGKSERSAVYGWLRTDDGHTNEMARRSKNVSMANALSKGRKSLRKNKQAYRKRLALAKALRKLKKSDETVYRGTQGHESKKLHKVKQGETFSYKKPKATSSVKSIAALYSGNDGDYRKRGDKSRSTRITFKQKHARQIHSRLNPEEGGHEHIMPPHKRFRVGARAVDRYGNAHIYAVQIKRGKNGRRKHHKLQTIGEETMGKYKGHTKLSVEHQLATTVNKRYVSTTDDYEVRQSKIAKLVNRISQWDSRRRNIKGNKKFSKAPHPGSSSKASKRLDKVLEYGGALKKMRDKAKVPKGMKRGQKKSRKRKQKYSPPLDTSKKHKGHTKLSSMGEGHLVNYKHKGRGAANASRVIRAERVLDKLITRYANKHGSKKGDQARKRISRVSKYLGKITSNREKVVHKRGKHKYFSAAQIQAQAFRNEDGTFSAPFVHKKRSGPIAG